MFNPALNQRSGQGAWERSAKLTLCDIFGIFGNQFGYVIEQMTDNPNFPNPNPSLETLASAKEDFVLALTKAEGGSKEDTAIKNNQRRIIENLLKLEGDYVQQVSEGDESIILSRGFDVNRKPALVGPFAKATGLMVKPGYNKGSIQTDCNVVDNARFYEFEYTEAPSSPNCNWIVKTSTKHKQLIEGFTSCKQYVFRVAGADSDPSQLERRNMQFRALNPNLIHQRITDFLFKFKSFNGIMSYFK